MVTPEDYTEFTKDIAKGSAKAALEYMKQNKNTTIAIGQGVGLTSLSILMIKYNFVPSATLATVAATGLFMAPFGYRATKRFIRTPFKAFGNFDDTFGPDDD